MDWNRLRNYGLWVSVFALIPLLVQASGKHVLPANYEAITGSILTILVLLGLINDPTTKNSGYLDDKGVKK